MHRALWTLLVFSGCRSWLCPEDGDGLDYCDPAACAEGTHAVDSGCADDQEPRVTYPNDDSGTDSGADSGTDSGSDSGADSASDSGADDSHPPPCDLDGDGFESTACGGADCDDEDAGVHPAAPDLWDQVDNNCDGLTDRTTLDTVSWASTSGSAADDRLTSIDNLCGGQDLTGDGVPDLAVGAPVHGSWDGAVLVLDGAQVGAWTGDAFADARLVVYGGGTTDNLGFLPDRFGDLNGDGVPDLLVGARAAPGGGAAYVFFGGAGLSGSASSASADRIITPGAGGASTGFAVESASDLDGDGAVDLLVADPAAGVGGVVALFRGLPGAATVSMDDADALLRGGAGERFGETTTGGDLDGDGYDDLLAGIPGSGGGDGGLVVVRGAATLPSGDAGAAQALRVLGSGGGQMAGNSRGVARPADLDASGRPDLAVSVYQALGAVLVFVDPDGGTLTAADATVRLEEPGQTLGSSLVSGDLDSDGVPDLLVGAYQDSSVHASGGAVYALWGGPHLSAGASLDRTTADAVLDATGPEQLLGTAVGFTGDLSGDGVPDWLVGASWDSTGAALGGTLHVLAGVP